MSLKGTYRSKTDNDIRIIVERDYKKKDTANFFYFMCKRTGGGIIKKDDLMKNWIKE